MAHIHTQEGQYDSTVSFFIVRMDTPEPTLMLHMHKKVGKLMMFGGHIELKENPMEAMLHELTEETGYLPHQLRILQSPYRVKKLTNALIHPTPVLVSSTVYPNVTTAEHPNGVLHNHTDYTHILVTSEAPAKKVGRHESKDIRLVTQVELNAFGDDEIVRARREFGNAIFDHFLKTYELVSFDEFLNQEEIDASA